MEIKELINSPQLIIVYAITIIYTIMFTLAAVIALPDHAVENPRRDYQLAKIETDYRKLLTAIHITEGSPGQSESPGQSGNNLMGKNDPS